MKYLKLQTTLLEEAHKRDERSKQFYWYYATSEDNVYVTDVFFAICIPKGVFYLDVEQVFRNRAPMKSMPSLFEKAQGAKEVIRTGTLEKVDKRTLELFKVGEQDVWADTKLLNWFDNDEYVTYMGTDYKSPIYILEDGDVVGLVLPVNRNKVRS